MKRGDRLTRCGIIAAGAAALFLLAACHQSGRPTGQQSNASPPAFGQTIEGKYIVAPGDTVAVVAKRTNTPIRTLIDLNGLQPPYRLKGGQRLALQPRIEYVVQPGDTVQLIALSEGVSPSALIQLNDLASPYQVQPGQVLILPSDRDVPQERAQPAQESSAEVATGVLAPLPPPSGEPAPIAAAPESAPNAANAAPAQAEQAPASGPVDLQAPAVGAENAGIATGALPSLPAASQSQQQASAKPAAPEPQPPAPEPQPAVLEPAPVAVLEPPPPPPPEPEAQVASLPKASADSGFIWPVDGKVVSSFGTTSDGLRNDGINIAAPEGAPVRAAADGVVAYAGNELRGFGNMILIKHADNWVTAYAHNSSLLVEKGDKVKQGDIIARVGSSGNVAGPQLHFEIRNGTKAVDPVQKLGG